VNLKLCRLALLLLLASVAFHVKAQSSTSEWKRYELGQGNFSVLFPREPREENPTAPASVGLKIESHIYSTGGPEGTFVAQYNLLGEPAAAWSAAAREIFQDSVWIGAAEGVDKQMEAAKLEDRTRVIEKRAIKFSGYPGREVVFTLGPLQGRMWTTLIGRQAFVAMVVGSSQTLPAQQKFLDSFTIKLVPLGSSPKQTQTP